MRAWRRTAARSPGEALRPTDDVVAENDAAALDGVTGGEPVDAGPDLSAAVSSMEVGGVSLDAWLAVAIRGEDTTNPEVSIVCTGTGTSSFDEGVVNLTLPEGECGTPAVVRVTFPGPIITFGDDEPEVRPVDFPLPDDVVAELNAAR